MRLIIDEHRQAYDAAKKSFARKSPSSFDNAEKFWKELGEEYNMQVVIPEWRGPYPKVEALEFNTEEAYVWFMLRFS